MKIPLLLSPTECRYCLSQIYITLTFGLCMGCQGTGGFDFPQPSSLVPQQSTSIVTAKPNPPDVSPGILPSTPPGTIPVSVPSTGSQQVAISPSTIVTPPVVQQSPPQLPTPTPTLVAYGNPWDPLEKVLLQGFVFDAQNKPVEGVKIIVTSLNSLSPFMTETTTYNGKYNVPTPLSAGNSIKILALKAGFTSRQQTVILRSNKQGDPNVNRYDFGSDGSSNFRNSYNAIMDLPEITKTIPMRNGQSINPNNNIILTFSEPMDRESVENGFTIRSFNSSKLSADVLNKDNTFTGSDLLTAPTGSVIGNKQSFNITWDINNTEVSFTFKNEMALPSDKDSNKVLEYQINFETPIKDKAGDTMPLDSFGMVDSDFCYNCLKPAAPSFKFAIRADENPPNPTTLIGFSGILSLTYSEPMLIRTKTVDVAGGMPERFGPKGSESAAPAGYPANQGNASERNVAKNYTVSVFSPGSTTPSRTGTWFQWGGSASYTPNDLLFREVWLTPPRNTSSSIENIILNYQTGTTVPLTQTISGDTQDNSIWNFGWQLIRSDGTLGPLLTSGDIETAQGPIDGNSLASLLQTQLNKAENTVNLTPPMNTNPWQVSVSADQKSLQLTLNDTSGHYVGWQSVGGAYQLDVADRLPTAGQFSNATRWEAGQFLKWFSSGQRVEVTVASTVTDPAGNGVSPTQRTVSVVIP